MSASLTVVPPGDTESVVATASSIRRASSVAITQLDNIVALNGEHQQLAGAIREIYANFQKLADDLAQTSEALAHRRG
jgi:hypothetical protein